MTLRRLLALAGLGRYEAEVWFADCELKGPLLLTPDVSERDCLERLFGARLRAVVSDLEFRVAGQRPEPPAYLNAAGRKDWRRRAQQEGLLLTKSGYLDKVSSVRQS